MGDDGTRLVLILSGTTNEELLRHGTSLEDKRIEVHQCQEGCRDEPHAPGFVHAKIGYISPPEREALLTWEVNLQEEVRDELPQLREMQKAAEAKEKESTKNKKKEKKSSSSSQSTKKKKSKKKKKKEKKEKAKEESVAKDTPEVSGRGSKAKKSSRRYGGRTIACKDLQATYGGTGMDPRSRIRRKVAAYASRKMKRRKDDSSSSSSSSDSGSLSSGTEEGADALQDHGKIRMLHRHAPGLLTSIAVGRMQNVITEVEGIWGRDSSVLNPVCLRYVRSQLASKLGGASLKEAVTLGAALDLLIQGRIAEGSDYLIQRLKSLEKIAQGVAWQTSEKLELAPGHVTQISSLAEMNAARKDAKLESENRGSNPSGKGQTGKGGKKGKQEEKGKGKRKEAAPKGGGGAS